MCGRYNMDEEMITEISKLVQRLDDRIRKESRTGDIRPSNRAPVLISAPGRDPGWLEAAEMVWGLPGFQKKGLIINARSETAEEKKRFGESLRRRRCVVPARRFYEWDTDKNKVTFYRKDDPVIFLAGFYEIIQEERRFVILTTAANQSMAGIHDRMPLILERGDLKEWLGDGETYRDLLLREPALLEKSGYQESFFFF